MKHSFYTDIRGPLVSGAGLTLGAAGGRLHSGPCPDPCEPPSLRHFSGSCPCGSLPRPL